MGYNSFVDLKRRPGNGILCGVYGIVIGQVDFFGDCELSK